MPYLSWQEGPKLRRLWLEGPKVLGSDPQRCTLVSPKGGPAVQAILQPEGIHWRFRPLDGAIVHLSGELVPVAGHLLADGDKLGLGSWELGFSLRFPGLDQERFFESPGSLPLPSGAAAAAPLKWVAGLAQGLEQGLLAEEDPSILSKRLLEETCSFLSAHTGLHIRQPRGEAWKIVERVGAAVQDAEPAHSLVEHALRDHTNLLSNDPRVDPRSDSSRPSSPGAGPMLVAPLLLEETRDQGGVESAFVLFRKSGAPGFSPSDLSLLRTAVDLAALAQRLSLVHRRLLSHAELESQLLHVRREIERQDERQGYLLASISHAINRAKILLRRLDIPSAEVIGTQLSAMAHLVEVGQSTDPGLAPPPGNTYTLTQSQTMLIEQWNPLAEGLGLTWDTESPPEGQIWIGGGPVLVALHSLLDPVLLGMPMGSSIPLRWKQESGQWAMDIFLPSNLGRVSPDAWSRGMLASAGVDWRWSDAGLSLICRESQGPSMETQERPMLGLVTEDLGLVTLFQGAADAGELGLFPLEEEPPNPPLPYFEIVVVDARGVRDGVECVRSYRAHPSFATTPILVVRARELDGPELLAAGATDWLADALRWESLHHRLQSLRSHRELQKKGRASERLETVRQMAGTLKHEINNPLAVISLQNELLQRKYPDEPKLAKIAEQVQRIQALMQVLQKMREPGDEEYPGGTNIMKL